MPLPRSGRVTHLTWREDGGALAMVAAPAGAPGDAPLEVWVLLIPAEAASSEKPLSVVCAGRALCGVLRENPLRWAGEELLIAAAPELQPPAPERPTVPRGPTIQEHGGGASPARTYQDLLASEHDEALFEHYATSVVLAADPRSMRIRTVGDPRGRLYDYFAASPDGQWLLCEIVERPFSRLVPASRFALGTELLLLAPGSTLDPVRAFAVPAAESIPISFDAVRAGPRLTDWHWREPATLVYFEALDGGDPRAPAAEDGARDAMMAVAAPGFSNPTTLLRTDLRAIMRQWTRDGDLIVTDRWRKVRPAPPHGVRACAHLHRDPDAAVAEVVGARRHICQGARPRRRVGPAV